jgi:hypothetical protein
MPHTAKRAVKMVEIVKATAIPRRTLYGMKARHPELWALLEDGIRYRKLKESMQ